jgi:hypothetical protein
MSDQLENYKARLREANESINRLKKFDEQKISQKTVQIGLRMLEEQKLLLEKKIAELTEKESKGE